MPTPRPDTGTQYIEISDFSPGIHSEEHSGVTPQFTASPTLRGTLLGNGVARVDNTSRCHADKTGALIPLPKPQPTGMRDTITPHAELQAGRAYRYVLDAQIGNSLTDNSETALAPFPQESRQLLQVMWGYYRGAFGFNFAVLTGREYRLWLDFPGDYTGSNLPIVDFIVCDTDAASTFEFAALPIGSLTQGRFYYGYTAGAFGTRPYTVALATDIFSVGAGHGFSNDDQVVLSAVSGGAGVVAGTIYFVRDRTPTTFKLAATQGGAAIDITTDGTGNVALVTDESFRPLWMYPVTVALAATPWARWGGGNYWRNGAFPDGAVNASFLGYASDFFNPHVRWSPNIGLKGEGTSVIGMELMVDPTVVALPVPTIKDRWFFHYSERGNVPQNNIIQDVAGGPLNPYMLVAHQGRIVFPDRRRTAGGFAETSIFFDHGYVDDLLFYSDYGLPTQNYLVTPLATDRGQPNAAYGEFPQATMEPYNKLLVAEDVVAEFGAVGVVTVDQLLVVKHFGGGALVSGDLDNPTQHRLPYIESTGGLICKGAHTPIGFVYGSDNGVFVWNGGESTEKLSPQLDGFFWDHTNGSDLEQYAGSRGRMAYWNGLICVPNNYVFDIERKSWWKLETFTLDPVEPDTTVPFNCYDVDERNLLYAWPYKHAAPVLESHVHYPTQPTFGNLIPAGEFNALTIPDVIGALTQLDVRFVIDNAVSGLGQFRTTISQWTQDVGTQRAWQVFLDDSNHVNLQISTDGLAGTVATDICDDELAIIPIVGDVPVIGRVTWRSSDGRVQFFRKSAAGPIKPLIRSHDGWEKQGADELGHVVAAHNSTAPIAVGNTGATANIAPYDGNIFAVWMSNIIDGEPVIEILPENIPTDPNAASFPAQSGHTVTVVRVTEGPSLELVHVDQTTPVCWYTFDQTMLDEAYSWQSHPLVESQNKVLSFQSIELVVTGRNTIGLPATITATLVGFGEDGVTTVTRATTLTLDLTTEVQLLRGDILRNFNAQYVTLRLEANSPTDGVPAPKIHQVRIAFKERATTPRHGRPVTEQ